MDTATGHADDYVRRAIRYADAILSGDIVSCLEVKQATKRFKKMLTKSRKRGSKYIFSPWHGNDICDFVEKLQHVEGVWPRDYKLVRGCWVKLDILTRSPKHNVNRLEDLPPPEQGWWYQDIDGWMPRASKAPDAVFVKNGVTVRVEDDPYIVLEDAQIFWLCCIFGFRRRSNGLRLVTQFYIEIARKNAKSTLLAGIKLYCLCCENERGPQIWSGATTYKQARIVFDVGRKMVRKDSDLRDTFGLKVWANSITCANNGGFWQPIHSKAETQDGLNPHVAGLDEVHAHKTPALYNVLKSAIGARKQPLVAMITTAGYILEGIGYSTRSVLKKVLAGVLEMDHFWGIIYTLDKGDDPYDPKVWVKANPLLGVSVTVERLQETALEAKADTLKAREFETKHVNQWLNAAASLIDLNRWDRCADSTLQDIWPKPSALAGYVKDGEGPKSINIGTLLARHVVQFIQAREDLKVNSVRIGSDLADRDDIASVVLEIEDEQAEVITWLDFHFLPKDLVQERAETVTAHYQAWADGGFLVLTEGDYIDHRAIEGFIRELTDHLNVIGIGFDQFSGAQNMAARLVESGYDAVIYKKNASNYTEPTKDMLARLKIKRIRHAGGPVLKWMASNVHGELRVDGSLVPKKEHSHSNNKIDGIDAGLIASGLRISEEKQPESVFAGGVNWDDL